MQISVVIPVFNEVESLRLLGPRLVASLDKISTDYEIIYVDDASRDDSLSVLKSFEVGTKPVKIISFKDNQGQSEALRAGFNCCSGEWVITLDADCQNPPEEIQRLWLLRDEFDYLSGVREKRQDSLIKRLASRIARFSRRVVLGDTTQDSGCALRLFRRKILVEVFLPNNFHRFFTFLVRSKGFSVKEVPITHCRREFGKSKYGVLKRLWQGLFDLSAVSGLVKKDSKHEVKH